MATAEKLSVADDPADGSWLNFYRETDPIAQPIAQQVELARACRLLARHERGVARRLAQAQQGLDYLDLGTIQTDVADLPRTGCCLGPVADVELAIDGAEVIARGLFGNAELVGDLAQGESAGKHRQELELTLR